MNLRTNVKFWFVALISLWGLIIFATLGQPAAQAQSRVPELKPPFKFVPASESNQPLVSLRPPGSTVIMTETFGVGFDPVQEVTGTLPLWRQVMNPTDTAGYYWDRVGAASPALFTNSAWSAGINMPGKTPLDGGIDPYPAGQDTWLLYGPVDLSQYMYGTLSFEYYLDATASDQLTWGVIAEDGGTVIGYNSQGGNGGGQWITATYQFDRALWGNRAVYLAFGFESGSTPAGLGPFIRNVRLNAESFQFVYLPVVVNNYPSTPTPTPTATPLPALLRYTFNAGNTDLAAWGGRFDGVGGSGSGTYGYGQCLPGDCRHTTNPHGNPANSLRLYNTAYWVMVGSSPNTTTPADYELHMDVSPVVLYPRNNSCGESCPPDNLGNWYGVMFNASANTFGATPGQFNYNGQYYRFYFYNADAVLPVGMALDRCSGGSCVRLGTSSIPTGLLNGLNLWDHIRIRRVGSLIEVYVNGTLIFNRNDTTLMSGGEFGVFTFPSDGNAVQYPPAGYEQQVDFDNIEVYNP